MPKRIAFSEVTSILICQPDDLYKYRVKYREGTLARAMIDWQLNPLDRHRISNVLRMRTFFSPELIFAVETQDKFIFRALYTVNPSDALRLVTLVRSAGVHAIGLDS